MPRAAIVSPVRTPVGAFGKSLRDMPVEKLGAIVVKEVLKRSGMEPTLIEDLIFAQSYANSETPCVGRWIALEAGLPVTVPGMQLDRRCGGGLQSIVTGAMMIESGACDVVLAGGIESMSNIEYYTTDMRWGARSGTTRLYDRLDRGRERSQPEDRFGYISGMIETAENLARDYLISREDSDAYAARSHQRAATAWDQGKFEAETVSVEVPQRKGAPIIVERDEGIRPDSTVESLSRLRALMKDGTVTAGNAAQQNDAAAACLIVSEDKLEDYGLRPMAFLKGWSAVGCEPSHMGIGPVGATRKVLQKTGLSMQDMGLVEINEAFAAQVLACLKGLDWDDQSILNVNGSGISLGHPIGATGVRIMTTLLHEMARRDVRYGLETMCVGGGQGMAAIFERA
ncbi:MAG TPA: acetyl-CoA C-acyltransferase [Hyphomonas sp.]|uniref:acetyl-CoA C-acetyltransferase n=1 Tax=Hyphomonas sp. UBA5107 TaxID=1946636 RepID=UPI000C351E31|nr:acetyl-CoA C-acetyltransferase [Hyphomonas sp. UBA5107]MAA81150.1 acetyl-CoA C-acyltransferase [Hyphomonas sp.]MAN65674.1 acetyl-CoA C-acyltransferase [Hyphomonadaceae bacterium]HBL92364.1 acetyl-CoA C-acyltransferase [Hyphomonas sp.]HCJ17946.1 acetyl-CoA C-acyltransferase [Hyphomonas sp.]HCN93735.1 acetyl-CoA C-acyltransferase [Hyphomonas sp.]|tara:strand:+ start:48084 stop:49280 length:1197 start_codon:yes stop_codon:yes gene_type:complete